MRELEYPFDAQYLLRKRRSIRKTLLQNGNLQEKHIAILGGSTTHDIKEILELFLLNYGLLPVFYESEYAQYWQDAMFENSSLDELKPDIIFIHTTNRNISRWPQIDSTRDETETLLDEQYEHFLVMWEKLHEKYHCPIIQNNFDYLFYRLLGNRDTTDYNGRNNFITRLNLKFAEYAQHHEDFFINDINYQSADYGLSRWADLSAWYLYKYALSMDAIPTLTFNIANIIKSIYGKNKKAFALDLDNTLWGGVVGDDGPENLELGQESALGQAYQEFQEYLKQLKNRGILLNIISKNEKENAEAGLYHPQMILKKEDFISEKVNWEPKSDNLKEMAQELSLLPESFVFADDNPAEREIVRQQVPGTGVPELINTEEYIRAVDKAGFFEMTSFTKDDLIRNEMYRENAKRLELQHSFSDYKAYLLSLHMKAEINPFCAMYMARISQLTNKSNQFNLTTLRCTQDEIQQMASDDNTITLYGKLEDCFGDNGVVALTAAKVVEKDLHIVLWLMSCRVLKRDMEYAMIDMLVREARKRGIQNIYGYFYPTAKNAMVKHFYSDIGFKKVFENEDGSSKWLLSNLNKYTNQNKVIEVNGEGNEQRGNNI